ncbi:hypothetical protein IJJ08_03080 [bacterium]|nr:hypothetical protein [bacterium]
MQENQPIKTTNLDPLAAMTPATEQAPEVPETSARAFGADAQANTPDKTTKIAWLIKLCFPVTIINLLVVITSACINSSFLHWLALILLTLGTVIAIVTIVNKRSQLLWVNLITYPLLWAFVLMVPAVSHTDAPVKSWGLPQAPAPASPVDLSLEAIPAKDLKLENYGLIQPSEASGAASVTGVITNKGRQALEMPVVSFYAYDQANNRLATTCTDVKYEAIQPGEQWAFTATCGLETVSRVELAEINYTQVKEN